ncbi:MAG: helix-turn-helix domain-containing protein [Rhodocyclales bacterium]|nr:helix-turn-helix domain-containing protein [Rhodocyclales bacterium]
MSYSTRGMAARDQFAYWREWVCGSITQLTADRDTQGPFHGEIRVRSLDTLKIVTARADAHRRTRTAADIARRSEDGFFVYLPLSGALRVEPARGESFVAPPGTPCFLNPCQSAALVLNEAHTHVALSIPRADVASMMAHPDGHFGHRTLAGGGLGPLLASYIGGLGDPGAVAAHLEAAVAANFCSLLALALGANDEGRERGRDGVAAARLQAALRWIELNFAETGVAPAQAAAQLGISARYLHKLFETTGLSFSETLARRRLQACRGALLDPALDRRSIAEIALSCGFGDISHFNRSFRAAYGLTPREARLARH